jgi:hypothetical protein
VIDELYVKLMQQMATRMYAKAKNLVAIASGSC